MTKKKKDTMSSVAMSGIMGTTIVGATSSATGYGAGISANYATGVSKVGTALPVMGKVKGTTMVLNSFSKLKKHKLLKGGKKL